MSQYVRLAGSFGETENDMTNAQISFVMQAKSKVLNNKRLDHLIYPSDHSIQNNGTIYHSKRSYGYANTAFNFELGVAVADGIVQRMEHHPAWNELRYDAVESQLRRGMNENFPDRAEVMGRLDLSAANDFQLGNFPNNINSPSPERFLGEPFRWNGGSTSLDKIVSYRILDRIKNDDPQMAEALAPVEELMTRMTSHWFDLRGEERANWLQSASLYEWDFRPQNIFEPVRQQVYDYLATKPGENN